MGYRSEVHLAVYTDSNRESKLSAHDKFVTAYTHWRFDNNVDFPKWPYWETTEIINHKSPYRQAFGFLFMNEGVKWYTGYQDVDDVMETIDLLPNYGFKVEFLRIGEDASDIDQRDLAPEGEEGIWGMFWPVHTTQRCSTLADVEPYDGGTLWIADYATSPSTIGDQHSAIQPASTAESEKLAV